MPQKESSNLSSMMDEIDDVDPKRYFILSKDYLRNLRIDQGLSEGWKNHPPLFQGKNAKQKMKVVRIK